MFWTVTLSLLEGLWTSIELFLLTLLFSLPLGLLIAFGSMSRWAPIRSLQKRWPKLTFLQRIASRCPRLADFRPVSSLTNLVVWIIRGTPLMLQLIIIFYGPGMWFDNNIWLSAADVWLPAWWHSYSIMPATFPSSIEVVSRAFPRGNVKPEKYLA